MKEITKILRLCTKLPTIPSTLLEDVCDRYILAIGHLPLDTVINTMARVTSAKHKNIPFMRAVSNVCVRHYGELTPAHKVTMIVAFDRFEHFPNGSLLHDLANDVQNHTELFTCDQLCSVAQSLATLRLHQPKLYAAVDAVVARRRSPTLSLNALCELVWALVTVSATPSPELWQHTAQRVLGTQPFSANLLFTRSICRLAMATAVLQRYDPELMPVLLTAAQACLDRNQFSNYELGQLKYVRMYPCAVCWVLAVCIPENLFYNNSL